MGGGNLVRAAFCLCVRLFVGSGAEQGLYLLTIISGGHKARKEDIMNTPFSRINRTSKTDNDIHAFKHYGLTGQTIKVRAREDSQNYSLWGDKQVPVKITGEYPNFLCGTVLPHMDSRSGKESLPYPITIHKHDIILLEVIPEYGNRLDYGDRLDGAVGIGTLSELIEAVHQAVVVKETERMTEPRRWQLTSIENAVTSCRKAGITVEVFPHGFVAATCGYKETVFQLEDCLGSFRDRDRRNYDAGYFTALPWQVRLLLEAEDRLGVYALMNDDNPTDEKSRVKVVRKMFEA